MRRHALAVEVAELDEHAAVLKVDPVDAMLSDAARGVRDPQRLVAQAFEALNQAGFVSDDQLADVKTAADLGCWESVHLEVLALNVHAELQEVAAALYAELGFVQSFTDAQRAAVLERIGRSVRRGITSRSRSLLIALIAALRPEHTVTVAPRPTPAGAWRPVQLLRLMPLLAPNAPNAPRVSASFSPFGGPLIAA